MANLSFNQGQRQSLKQSHRLMMSPQMQQAIQTLQMALPELIDAMRAEIAINPIFEEVEWREDEPLELSVHEAPLESDTPNGELHIDENDFSMMTRLDDEFRDLWAEAGNYLMQRTREEAERKNYHESSIPARLTPFETLLLQAREQLESDREIEAAEQIIGNLDESGLLTTPIEEIAALSQLDVKLLDTVLSKIHRFTPFGIGARSIQESLLIQLECRHLKDSVAYQIVQSHFDDLLHNRIRSIQRALRLPIKAVEKAIRDHITPLDTHPASSYLESPNSDLLADVTIEEGEDGGLIAHVNNERLPTIQLNQNYLRMLRDPESSQELRDYLESKLISGKWLLRTIDQRSDTLLRIAHYLISHQREYLSDPAGGLKPMTMKEMADALELHESTIARAVAQKNLFSPRGLVPLRSLFTTGYATSGGEISADTVRREIEQLLAEEDRRTPLSDEAIAKELQSRGISCARRTVAKHRAALGFGNASQRRIYS